MLVMSRQFPGQGSGSMGDLALSSTHRAGVIQGGWERGPGRAEARARGWKWGWKWG